MSGTGVTIRAAERRDCPALADMMETLAREGERADPRFRPEPSARDAFLHHAREHWFGRFLPFPACFVAQSAGGLVGMVAGSPAPAHPAYAVPPTARLEHLWVAPESRRNGVARQLVSQFVRAAESAGYPRLEVTTLHQDPRATSFWAALGFGPWMITLTR